MPALLVRLLLLAGGAVAAVFVARDAPNFGVVQGMATIALVAAVVILVALSRRK